MAAKDYKDGVLYAAKQIEMILDKAERDKTIVFVYSDIRKRVEELKKEAAI